MKTESELLKIYSEISRKFCKEIIEVSNNNHHTTCGLMTSIFMLADIVASCHPRFPDIKSVFDYILRGEKESGVKK